MPEDRIDAEFTIGYRAVNKAGLATIEIIPTRVIIRDQSPQSASAHLAAVMGGFISPATAQAAGQ